MIVGITRGGWIPSVLLSDELGVKDLLALKIEHWGITAKKSKKARLIVPLNLNLKGRKILVVDDLTDTGESLELALKHLKENEAEEIKVATLIHKQQSTFIPEFYVKKVEEWKWIIFPWNINEDLSNLMKKISPKKVSLEEMKVKLKDEFEIEVDKKTIKEVMENAY